LDSAVLRGALQAVLQLKTMYDQAAKNAMEPVCEGLCRLVASVGEHNADLIISMQACHFSLLCFSFGRPGHVSGNMFA
jgi:hypothetical protein